MREHNNHKERREGNRHARLPARPFAARGHVPADLPYRERDDDGESLVRRGNPLPVAVVM